MNPSILDLPPDLEEIAVFGKQSGKDSQLCNFRNTQCGKTLHTTNHKSPNLSRDVFLSLT